MGRTLDAVPADLAEFIGAQPVFFVATAPLEGTGHVNLSPKGGDAVRLLDGATLAYLDLTGSGAETIAHLRQNGRITLMWCAFEGRSRIVRVHGRGEAVVPSDPRFAELSARFPARLGVRCVVRIDVERVSTSCGFGVPVMRLEGERDDLQAWAARKGPAGVAAYQHERNAVSIDGLPALATDQERESASENAARATSS